MRQKKSNFKLILVAVSGAVLISSFFLLKARNARQAEIPDTSMVMIAKVELGGGSTLDETKYDWKEASSGQINDQTVTKNRKDIINDIEGAIVKDEIEQGGLIKLNNLIKVGGKSALSTVIRKGMRAVPVPFSKLENPPTLIAPGDVVDIILPRQSQDADTPDKTYIGQTILKGIRVLAVDSALQKSDVDGNITGAKNTNRTMTLEVTAEQAEDLGASIRDGRIILSVRSIFSKAGDNDMPKKTQKTGSGANENFIIKVIRGTESKDVTIDN